MKLYISRHLFWQPARFGLHSPYVYQFIYDVIIIIIIIITNRRVFRSIHYQIVGDCEG